MPIIRVSTPEIKKAKSRAELVKRFTAAEDGSKEAIGRAKTLEKNLTVAFERIKALELRVKTLDKNLEIVTERHSDMLDALRIRTACAGFILAALVAGMVIYALKLAGAF